MSFDTIVTVPTDGGNFNFHAKNFAWEKIDDNHTLIVYAQTNPVRLYARIVTFNGAATPTLGDAYSIVSPASVLWSRDTNTRLYPKIGFLDVERTQVAIFFRRILDSVDPTRYDNATQGLNDVLEYVICDVDINAGSVVPRGEPYPFNWVTGMSYDVKSVSEYDPGNGVPRYLVVVWRNGTNMRVDRATSWSGNIISWSYQAQWIEVTSSPSYVGGVKITQATQSGYDRYITLSNDYLDLYPTNSSSPYRNREYDTTSSNSVTIYMTSGSYSNTTATGKLVYDGLDCVTSLTPTVCVFARGNEVCTKHMRQATPSSYDSVHTDILTGMNAGEQIGQILRINDTTFMAIQRNPTLGGAAKIWVFGTGWSTLPPVIDFNTNNPFTVNNFPCDVPNGAETDVYQYNNIDTWKNMSWNDVAQWDSVSSIMRVYGVIDDGAGNPVIGIGLIAPTA